jgi:hypothetical protein
MICSDVYASTLPLLIDRHTFSLRYIHVTIAASKEICQLEAGTSERAASVPSTLRFQMQPRCTIN